ncbi:MAG: hypothetical protein V4722_06000 [Bacteroidota bacterium]
MRGNKFYFTILALTLSLAFGCVSKIIEQKKEDLLVNLITGNTWIMRSFYEGPTDLTSGFEGYEFKFNTDGTVYGTKPGFPNAVGTWAGNTSTMSVQSNFPAETGVFKKLNGTFNITSTTPTEVKANRFESAVEYKLHLVIK